VISYLPNLLGRPSNVLKTLRQFCAHLVMVSIYNRKRKHVDKTVYPYSLFGTSFGPPQLSLLILGDASTFKSIGRKNAFVLRQQRAEENV
jgi:hypothetical protein